MISLEVHAALLDVPCEDELINPGHTDRAILLENGKSIPLYTRRNGSQFIYLFPFVRTDVTFKEGEPFITVFRGIKDVVDTRHASGPIDRMFGTRINTFGDHIYTSLRVKTAIRYMNNYRFSAPDNISLIRLSLPLRLAYVAKGEKNFASLWTGDTYIPALENRDYMWFKWKASIRRKERELIWNLQELGGDLSDPIYDIKILTESIERLENGAPWNWSRVLQATNTIREKIKNDQWD